MAGNEWIKLVVHEDHPKIQRLAELTGAPPTTILSQVIRWFRYVDQNCVDGRVGIGVDAFHRVTRWGETPAGGRMDLAQALRSDSIGWLRLRADGTLEVVDFEVHFGAGAKRRALDARRKTDLRRRDAQRRLRADAAAEPEPEPEKRSKTREEKDRTETVRPPPWEEIFEAWNHHARQADLPICRVLTERRRRRLRRLWGQPEFRERFREALDRVAASEFCRGRNARGWVMSFDSFLTHWAPCLEGQYDDRRPAPERPARPGEFDEPASALPTL